MRETEEDEERQRNGKVGDAAESMAEHLYGIAGF